MYNLSITTNGKINSIFVKANSYILRKYECNSLESLKDSWLQEFNAILNLEKKQLIFNLEKDLTILCLKFS